MNVVQPFEGDTHVSAADARLKNRSGFNLPPLHASLAGRSLGRAAAPVLPYRRGSMLYRLLDFNFIHSR